MPQSTSQTLQNFDRWGCHVRNVCLGGGRLHGYLRLGYGWVTRDQAVALTCVRVPRGGR